MSTVRLTMRRLLAPAVGLLAAVLLWWAAVRLLPMPEQFANGFSPSSSWSALREMVSSGDLTRHLLPSLRRIAIGLTIAFAIGVPAGVTVGYFAVARHLTNTAFQFLRMISPLAWMPIAIIMFGVGDRPVYFLISIAAVWPILINTSQGVRGVEPGWIKVVRTLGGGQAQILRRAIIPAVIPDIITGLRISMGLAWVILVPAEMLGVSSGLGYFILDARDRFAYGELMACILVIGFVGVCLDQLLAHLEARLSWKADLRGTDG
jgi:NitT/TauT family transport system permease protein